MTRVEGAVARRSLNYGSFAHLTEVPVAPNGIAKDGITFDGDLSAAEQRAVFEWMTAQSDEDQAKRASLHALRQAVIDAGAPETLEEALAAVAQLQTAVADALGYWLGE